jgi:peptidoglycan/LPS O-acetylase OafA/YrhL
MWPQVVLLVLCPIFFSIILTFTLQGWILSSLVPQQKIDITVFGVDFPFRLMLLMLFPIMYIRRKKRIRLALGVVLGLAGHLVCFLNAGLSIQSTNEHKIIGLLLWCASFAILVFTSTKKEKRKQFSQLVRKQSIQRQENKCAVCRRRLEIYGLDFHHANGDRSNNKFSNCKVLCTPCHRRRHAQQ